MTKLSGSDGFEICRCCKKVILPPEEQVYAIEEMRKLIDRAQLVLDANENDLSKVTVMMMVDGECFGERVIEFPWKKAS